MATLRSVLPNIILITIDALRADHLSCYGYPKNTSPFIDKLASEGALFLQSISNGGGTPEAFPSILASVPPPVHPAQYNEVIKENITIAQVLKQHGYKTGAFHSNPYLSRFFHYDKGFDTFDDSMADPDLQNLVQGLSPKGGRFSLLLKNLRFFINLSLKGHAPIVIAEQLTSKAVSWLQGCSGQFFLWIHYMDTHEPYIPPRKYLKLLGEQGISHYKMLLLYNRTRKDASKFSAKDLKLLNSLYDASLRYVDDSISWLLNELGKHSPNNTLIILTADHGDAFGEHGKFGHGLQSEEVIHVPLIIKGPGVSQGVRIKSQVRHMDIAPTAIELLGLERVAGFCGESLLPMLRGEKQEKREGIISVSLDYPTNEGMYSYRTEDWKYICTRSLDQDGKVMRRELYDLKNDPKEIENLATREKDKVQAFESKIADYMSKAGRGKAKGISERSNIKGIVKKLKDSKRI